MTICIVLPTYNEEKIIEQNIDKIFNYCKQSLNQYDWKIIIADNGSKDKTIELVKNKKNKYPELEYFHLKTPGKGNAIKKAWQNYISDINIFMDADLATDLKHVQELIMLIEKHNYDLVVGSRYSKQSKLNRSFIRSVISLFYNLLIRIFFNIKISDTHCGFKAGSKNLVKKIVPKIQNNGLFFDTELIILSNYCKMLIKQIPVNWEEEKDRKTKIKIIKTGLNYLKQLIKLKSRLKKRDL